MTETHARTQLFERLLAEVKNIPNIDPEAVFDDPAKSLESQTLPSLAVVMLNEGEPDVLSETQEQFGITRFESRDLILGVAAVTKSREMRDEVCHAVEYRVINDVKLGIRRISAGADFDTTAEGSRRLWIAQMRFAITYHVRAHRTSEIVTVGSTA